MFESNKITDHIAIQAINNKKIYIYTITDLNGKQVNEGWLKVGETIRKTDTRVKEQVHTAGLKAEVLFEELALDINGAGFTDKDIHNSLIKRGFKNEAGTEWFTANNLSQNDLLESIKGVVKSRINCTEDFEQLKNTGKVFKLRPNQQAAVDTTFERWKIAQSDKSNLASINQFLWNAKPRFGKTLTAYEFAQKIEAKKILIITQRTSISDSWHKDYYQWVRDKTQYKFGSSKSNQLKGGGGRIIHTALSKSESMKIAADPEENLIFYISFADIKGKSESEFKNNNKWIFETNWNLFIIDETHEGSETEKAIEVFENLNTDFTLHLSGTPFKKIVGKDFNDKNTYTWSYADEQEYKNEWDYTNGENPYAEMPKLNIFTYQMSLDLRRACQSEEYSFDFAEFFKNDGEKFYHETEILQFLDNLASNEKSDVKDKSAQFYPFADPKTRNELRHSFWLLPMKGGINMTRLLKQLLKGHEYFKDYEVIMAAGSGDDDRNKSDKALHEVEAKIGSQPWKTKTITLSCGQLTTGITVAPWTAVLMLNNLSSPSQYLQAAFRSQNPWRYEIDEKIYNKTDCYVFDFAPDRILKIIDDYANLDVTRRENETRKNNVKKLINYLPVLALDRTGEMRYLEAAEVLEMPHYYDARDIVDNGFMSNKLFNIGNIFSLPKEKREKAEAILNQMEPVKNKKIKKNEPDLDSSEIDIPYNATISESPLGERQYEIQTTDEDGNTETVIISENQIDDLAADYSNTKNLRPTQEKLKETIEEIKQQKPKVKTEEDKQRDRLRGFSRTIPMFLMAYGKNTTKLSNFDEYVNSAVFEEIAGITRDEFRILRDECQFFNEARFNSAITEFLERKDKLKDYYKSDSGEDIFDYIPPQDTNQIFTPKKVVNMQLDLLEQNDPLIFKRKTNTFFDPQMKSGQYITEIAKRLYKNSKDKDIKRILTTQLYGLAPSKILTDITHEMIFGFAALKDKKKYQNNFVHKNLLDEDVNGKIIIKEEGGLQNVINELWGNDLRFDAVVGNPPYQEASVGNNNQATPVYNYFYESAEHISDKYVIISPARFLSEQGATPKSWNKKMLSDKHLKIIKFNAKSDELFPGVDIKGGVVVIYRDAGRDFGAIDTFIPFEELRNAYTKVKLITKDYISSFVYSPDSYRFSDILFLEHPELLGRTDESHSKAISSSVFTRYPEIFFISEPNDNQDYIQIYGRQGNERIYRWINRNYVSPHPNLDKWKVFVPGANGTGALGEILSTPVIGQPVIGHTQTFVSLGSFDTQFEAEALLKYIKSKFSRAMLGIMKTTQNNQSKSTWSKVPLQDFSCESDIDWSKSIPGIDQQLYKKYALNKDEIDFIESRVKPME
jgi:superfamily II DNA or RNA helicase